MVAVIGQAGAELLDETIRIYAKALGCPRDNAEVLLSIYAILEERDAARSKLEVEREITQNLVWAAKRENDWRDIDSAPKDGRIILVARDMGTFGWVLGTSRWDGAQGIYGWISRGISDPPGELGLGAPTHWRPLPAPPAAIDRASREGGGDG